MKLHFFIIIIFKEGFSIEYSFTSVLWLELPTAVSSIQPSGLLVCADSSGQYCEC